jgi:Ni/Fe-hydrogenase 1 B-type cytochrome subunit
MSFDGRGQMTDMKVHPVWDVSVRCFHWINVVSVLGLIAVGVAILNGKALGVTNDGKILLKTVHVWIGYAFALNLLWRLVWGFVGGPHARWRAILPGGSGFATDLRRYTGELVAGRPRQYLGHNPLGRIAVTLLLCILLVQAISGLILAGTDLFYPPIGSFIAQSVAAPGFDPDQLVPYAPQMYDKAAHDAMRAWRAPVGKVHYYGFYVLIAFGVIHIWAVVLTELRGGDNLVSAMVSGRKVLSGPPADQPTEDGARTVTPVSRRAS